MKRAFRAVLFLSMFSVLPARAQGPPAPAPELKKLDFFVGSWTTDFDLKPGSGGPGGKVSGTQADKWMEGGFFLTENTSFAGAMGQSTEVAFMGYDANTKLYTYDAFSSAGGHEAATGSVDGDTWTWLADQNMGGQKLKGRYRAKVLSPTSHAVKCELSPDGKNWSTVMEGKATKSQ